MVKLNDQITIIHTCLRAHFRTEQSNYYVTAISKEVAKVDSVSERVEILQKMAKQLKKIVLRYKKDGFSENERKICGSICKMFYEDYNIQYMYSKPGKGVQGRLNFDD